MDYNYNDRIVFWYATCRQYIYGYWFIMLWICISIFIYQIRKWASSYTMSFLLQYY